MVVMKKQRVKDLLLRACVVVRTSNIKISRRRLSDYFKTIRTKKRAARAARLLFLIQPIKSLICGVVVDVAIREFKIYDATVAKTSLKIASSSFSIYFAIMSVCVTFES